MAAVQIISALILAYAAACVGYAARDKQADRRVMLAYMAVAAAALITIVVTAVR